MPNLDQTGPTGQGPLTGRGQGSAVEDRGGDFAMCVKGEMEQNGLTQEEAQRVCSYQKRKEPVV